MSAAKPSFTRLWNAYSKTTHNGELFMKNQCAIRVSRALIKAGWSKNAFRNSQYAGKRLPSQVRARRSGSRRVPQPRLGHEGQGWSNPGGKPSGAARGVVCFTNIPTYGGQGHIDLWDGTRTKTGEYWSSETIWLWHI